MKHFFISTKGQFIRFGAIDGSDLMDQNRRIVYLKTGRYIILDGHDVTDFAEELVEFINHPDKEKEQA